MIFVNTSKLDKNQLQLNNREKMSKQEKEWGEEESTFPYFIDYSSYLSAIGHQNWLEIMKNKETHKIKDLDLEYCKINDNNVKQFNQFPWPCLRNLNIRQNQLTGYGINELAFQLDFSRLTKLILGYNKIGSAGIKMLVKIAMPNLAEICLCSSQIGNEGAKHLTKLKCPKLRKMRMKNNYIKEDGTISFTFDFESELNDISLAREEQHPPISYMLFVSVKTKKLTVPITIENGTLREQINNIYFNRFRDHQ